MKPELRKNEVNKVAPRLEAGNDSAETLLDMKTFSDKLISPYNKQHRGRTLLDVLETTAGPGHSHRRAFSLQRNFVTHVDKGTLISEIYYGKTFPLKRRVSLGLYVHPVTWLRASRPRNRGSILVIGKIIFISRTLCSWVRAS